jgi:hypothetical protein
MSDFPFVVETSTFDISNECKIDAKSLNGVELSR